MTQYMMAAPARPQRRAAERATDLLARYPDVSRNEAIEILTFLRNGRYLDVGELISDRGLGRNLDAFLKDHWVQFHLDRERPQALVGATAVAVFLLVMLWAALS